MRFLLTALCSFLLLAGNAQVVSSKIDIPLRSHIDFAENPNQKTHLIIHGNVNAVRDYVKAHNGVFKYSMGNKAFISLPVKEIDGLAKEAFVTHIVYNPAKGQTMNDVMRQKNNVNQIHAGYGNLAQSYKGNGVLMGFIDTGAEWDHPDFKDSVGNSRILRIWDQEDDTTTGRTPATYGYGAVWTNTDIDLGNCTQVDFSGHGSSVMGTAGGNGESDTIYTGVAPESGLIMVKNDLGAANWTATVADGIDYCFRVADSLGMPCVVNASVGTYFGGHDGRDDVALFIDSLVEAKRGRVVVCAAGNAGNLDFHLGHDIDSDTSWTWFKLKGATSTTLLNYDAVYFEVWGDYVDLDNVNFCLGADTWGWNFRGETNWYNVQSIAGMTVYDSIWNNGNLIGPVEFRCDTINGRYRLEVQVREPDSLYLFRWQTTGMGHQDIWAADYLGISKMITSPLPPVAQVPEIVYFEFPDINQTIVDSWNCSDKVISVANYTGRTAYLDYNSNLVTVGGIVDDIHNTSSFGPTRDNRTKPDVAATGQIALTCGTFFQLPWLIANQPFKVAQSGLHVRNGGTSQASPVVTGIAALMLEQCPTASWSDVKNAILNTANSDNNTGSTPNNIWGAGKVDGFDALLSNIYTIPLAGDTSFCDSTELIAPAGFASYLWNTGDTTQSVWVYASDTLSVIVVDSAGCEGSSGDYHTVAYTAPAQPVISFAGDTLWTDGGFSYQWYQDGNPINGANDSIYIVTQTGFYSVEITNAGGCTNISNALWVQPSGMPEIHHDFKAWPNPFGDVIFLQCDGPCAKRQEVTLFNSLGQQIMVDQWITTQGRFELKPGELAPGVYYIRLRADEQQVTLRMVKH